jgi:hypothetical protein
MLKGSRSVSVSDMLVLLTIFKCCFRWPVCCSRFLNEMPVFIVVDPDPGRLDPELYAQSDPEPKSKTRSDIFVIKSVYKFLQIYTLQVFHCNPIIIRIHLKFVNHLLGLVLRLGPGYGPGINNSQRCYSGGFLVAKMCFSGSCMMYLGYDVEA